MARYSSPSKVEQEVYALKFADYPRATNRALIDSLVNGNPPFTASEAAEAGIKTNVNFLEPAKIHHDSCRQFYNAFLTPGKFFTINSDYGPGHKQKEQSTIITTEINKILKESNHYRETFRNVISQVVSHGVGPSNWACPHKWVPSMLAMGDLLIPSRTLLTMENLTKFAIRRRYTAEELWKLTRGKKVDKSWNMSVVNKAIAWAKKESDRASNSSFSSTQSPEMWEEDMKENSGFYSSDKVPTIDCLDFYFLDETNEELGWKRRIILDTGADSLSNSITNITGGKNEFIYDSGDRNYARKLSEILHFQFADGSSVAPFRYHSVRSLGFLLYSVCHLQNRFRCRVTDAFFEHLIQYFRVNDTDDAERTLKLALADKGILPDGITFVPRNERWQVDGNLIGMALGMNRQTMEDNSTSYTQDYNFAKDEVEKTATQVTAEVTASSALVSSMLQEAYGYQEFQYREICRRFCIPNSRDLDVKTFRLNCIKKGVPIEALNSDHWTVSAERIIGGGNKQMELGQVNMLMSQFNRFGPDAQKDILRNFTFAATSDPALTLNLVPYEQNKISDARHDAQLATASLMFGLPVDIKPSINHIDYVEALLLNMSVIIQKSEQKGGMATEDQIVGLQNMAQHVSGHIEIIAQDKEENQRVKSYNDVLGRMMNMVKAYAQRLQEKMQEQGQGGDPELNAKIQALLVTAQSKAKIAEATSAMKLEQKQITFQQKTEQAQAKAETENARTIRKTQVDEASTDLKTLGEIQRASAKSEAEGAKTSEGQPAQRKSGKRKITFKRGKDGAIEGAEVEEKE